MIRRVVMCVLGLILMGVTVRGDEPLLDPQQPYSAERSRPVTYDFELVVTITPPYQTKRLRVWLPIPRSDQGQDVLSSELTTFPDEVRPQIASEAVFGNRFAYFEYVNPAGAQVIHHKLKVRVWELRWQLDPDYVQMVRDWPDTFTPYRRSETQAVVADERFSKLLAEIVPQRRNDLSDLTSVLTWVDDHFTYDHVQASLQANSLQGLEQHRGHCSDYHSFCAAMGRVLGQPTRVTYGLNTFPKSSPSHCKLEVFLPPYGWVSFDVSETQKLTRVIRENKDLMMSERTHLQAAARNRLVSGFRDNTWFVQTHGTDYELVPPASKRVPVVRTIYAEADGKALPDPDPSSREQTTFAWMTAVKVVADTKVSYPFTDISSLKEWRKSPEVGLPSDR